MEVRMFSILYFCFTVCSCCTIPFDKAKISPGQRETSVNVHGWKGTILLSVRENNHQEGVGWMMNQKISETLIEWKPIDGKIFYILEWNHASHGVLCCIQKRRWKH